MVVISINSSENFFLKSPAQNSYEIQQCYDLICLKSSLDYQLVLIFKGLQKLIPVLQLLSVWLLYSYSTILKSLK